MKDLQNNITLVKQVKESDTIYTEFSDYDGNEFIYEDGELKNVIIRGTHIHIYSDGYVEIQK